MGLGEETSAILLGFMVVFVFEKAYLSFCIFNSFLLL